MAGLFSGWTDECRISGVVSDSDHDGPPPGTRRVRLDLTLRRVEPNEELVYLIEKRTAELEGVVRGRARCELEIEPKRKWDRDVGYEVHIRVVGGQDYAEATYVDANALLAVRDAFDVVQRRLERASSGIVLKNDAGEHRGSDGDGSAGGSPR
mgnify:CR=1 FL=1